MPDHDADIVALMHHIGDLRHKLTEIAARSEEPRSAADAREALAQSLRMAPEPEAMGDEVLGHQAG